jgi:cobalt-zinc-cadmium efflux system protein
MGASSHHRHGALALAWSVASVLALLACLLVSRSTLVAADLLHSLVDLGGLAVGETALVVAHRRGPTRQLTFGLGRLDSLAGLGLSALLVAANVWITISAAHELAHPVRPPLGALSTATVIVGVNALAVLWLLARTTRSSLSRRSNLQHAAGDLATFVVTAIALASWRLLGWAWVLPVATIVIAVLVTISALVVARAALSILLEAAPHDLQVSEVSSAICAIDHVSAVHHVHLWQLDAQSIALSAHVLLDGAHTVHETQLVVAEIKAELARRFGIDHATLEAECHACATPAHTVEADAPLP